MATLRQIEANRRNAQLSTGPRSVEGKAASRLNALKTGIDAKTNVIGGEDPAALEALAAEYFERWNPTTPEARALVDSLISNEWLLRRLRRAEADLWNYRLLDLGGSDAENGHMLGKVTHYGGEIFTRLQRRLDSVERNYHRALKELQHLQSDSQEIGFVSSSADKAPSDPAPEPPEPEVPVAIMAPDPAQKSPTEPDEILSTPPASPANPPAGDCG